MGNSRTMSMQDAVLNLSVKLRDQQRLDKLGCVKNTRSIRMVHLVMQLPAVVMQVVAVSRWILKCKGWETEP
ncbi:hypothetical protein ACVXHA_15745 [Escherichia coli]